METIFWCFVTGVVINWFYAFNDGYAYFSNHENGYKVITIFMWPIVLIVGVYIKVGEWCFSK